MIEPLGESAWRISIPAGLDRRVLLARLRELPGAIDAHVSETHACVSFEGARPMLDEVALGATSAGEALALREHRIEVAYDGPDLDEAAGIAGLDRELLIARHSGAVYEVSFVGFLPGFAYLRGLDPALAAIPRRASPRARVAAGSVGIAGGFTGIYPFDSPGGWRLIGRAPSFAPLDRERATLAIGDRVRVVRIG